MYFNRFLAKKHIKNNIVGHEIVGQTVKISIRLAGRNYKKILDKVSYINSLSTEMQTDFSKTLNNILDDYFLDEEIETKKLELEGIE